MFRLRGAYSCTFSPSRNFLGQAYCGLDSCSNSCVIVNDTAQALEKMILAYMLYDLCITCCWRWACFASRRIVSPQPRMHPGGYLKVDLTLHCVPGMVARRSARQHMRKQYKNVLGKATLRDACTKTIYESYGKTALRVHVV